MSDSLVSSFQVEIPANEFNSILYSNSYSCIFPVAGSTSQWTKVELTTGTASAIWISKRRVHGNGSDIRKSPASAIWSFGLDVPNWVGGNWTMKGVLLFTKHANCKVVAILHSFAVTGPMDFIQR